MKTQWQQREYRYKIRIANKLVVTFVSFVTIFIGSTGWFLYRTTKNSLDDELGSKLVAIARAVTTQIDAYYLTQLSEGDEDTLTYLNLLKKLNNVKEATGVKRLYIFDRDRRSLVDTEEGCLIGTEYANLRFKKSELESLWNGNSVYTVLFKSEDGIYYKSGYAPIMLGENVVAAVGVDTSADFMKVIAEFRRNVIIFALISMMMTIIVGFLFANTITRPLNQLVKVAQRFSKGEFGDEIKLKTRDEIGYLGMAMEDMRKAIIDRDNRLKMMLANVAHEIRNPLGGIEIFAGILSEELEDETKKEYIQKIIKEVKSLNDTITQFLEYARPKEPIRERVKLCRLIDDTCFLLSPELEAKGIQLINESNLQDVEIFVDQAQTKSVLINIIKNAIQVMNNGGQLKISCSTEGQFACIMISNNGPAIPKGDLNNIFEPFFTTKEKGAGLGLAIAKKFVEDNDGKIEVESEPGSWTTFKIYLPLIRDNVLVER